MQASAYVVHRGRLEGGFSRFSPYDLGSAMDILERLGNAIARSLDAERLFGALADGDYRALLSDEGIVVFLQLVVPALLAIELLRAVFTRTFRLADWKVPFMTMVFNRVVAAVLSLGLIGFSIAMFQPLAPFQVGIGWLGLLYGYAVWELSHFVYHYSAHKVRLLWCLHSTHHAPTRMNMSVNYAHVFLEAPYYDLLRTSICMLAGVSPPLLVMVMVIHGVWGKAVHLGEGVLEDGRFGFLHRWILTPAHHRAHHARNVEYMDTNFCNLFNIWDRLFGTYQPQIDGVAFEYGITRPVKPGSFLDANFGEFWCLARDVAGAPGLKNKLFYLLMPPGWSHDGNHKTARVLKARLRAEQARGAVTAVAANVQPNPESRPRPEAFR